MLSAMKVNLDDPQQGVVLSLPWLEYRGFILHLKRISNLPMFWRRNAHPLTQVMQ